MPVRPDTYKRQSPAQTRSRGDPRPPGGRPSRDIHAPDRGLARGRPLLGSRPSASSLRRTQDALRERRLRARTRLPVSQTRPLVSAPRAKPPVREQEPSRRDGSVWLYLVGGLVIAAYFLWVCLQMAAHVQGGDVLLVQVFGFAAACAVAAAVGLGGRGLRSQDPSSVGAKSHPRGSRMAHRSSA